MAAPPPPRFIEVDRRNFQEEFERMKLYAQRLKFIAIDTEFPGKQFEVYKKPGQRAYHDVAMNVNQSNCIQIGFCVSGENGAYPRAWNFNLEFNLADGFFNPDSIFLLMDSGLDFSINRTYGIPVEMFRAAMVESGLLFKQDFSWVFFHGNMDIAYFVRIISGNPLPESLLSFQRLISTSLGYRYYDVKYLGFYHKPEPVGGGLRRFAEILEVPHDGNQHLAAQDAYVTMLCFHKIITDRLQTTQLGHIQGLH